MRLMTARAARSAGKGGSVMWRTRVLGGMLAITQVVAGGHSLYSASGTRPRRRARTAASVRSEAPSFCRMVLT
jgi:hypothetical protein